MYSQILSHKHIQTYMLTKLIWGSAKFSVSDISKFMFYENCGEKSIVYTGMYDIAVLAFNVCLFFHTSYIFTLIL